MYILNSKGSIARRRALDLLKQTISIGRVRNNAHATKLIFLCGGLKKDRITVSERRRQVEIFLRDSFKANIEVFFAEEFIKSYSSISKSFELLDLENDLFRISDRVILILEGYGAACELGSFANEKGHRTKLIVINDKKYISEDSFIKLGPLRSIELANFGEKRVLYYSMSPDGKENIDAIAHTFLELQSLILKAAKDGRSQHGVKLKLDLDFSPVSVFTQMHLFFVHDIIHLCGPVASSALFEIFQYVFGKRSFEKVHTALSLLKACGMVDEENGKTFSVRKRLFLSYTKMSRNQIIAAFRI